MDSKFGPANSILEIQKLREHVNLGAEIQVASQLSNNIIWVLYGNKWFSRVQKRCFS